MRYWTSMPVAAALMAGGLAFSPSARALPQGFMAVPSGITAVANTRTPYRNVDRSSDAGNNTGDSEVERLNEMQLDRNYRGPTYLPGQPPPPAVPMRPLGAPPGYAQPSSGYAPPPPGYAQPPPGYAPPAPGYAPPPPGYAQPQPGYGAPPGYAPRY
jgi:hypothetical protein